MLVLHEEVGVTSNSGFVMGDSKLLCGLIEQEISIFDIVYVTIITNRNGSRDLDEVGCASGAEAPGAALTGFKLGRAGRTKSLFTFEAYLTLAIRKFILALWANDHFHSSHKSRIACAIAWLTEKCACKKASSALADCEERA